MDTQSTTPAKATATDSTIKVINAIFGTAHFIFQSAADLTAESEGRLIEKVSKGAITKQQAIDNRKNSTLIKQQNVLNHIQKLKDKAQSKTEDVQPLTVAHESHSA